MLGRLQGLVMIDADVTKEEGTFSNLGQFLCELNYASGLVFGLLFQVRRLVAKRLNVVFDFVDVSLISQVKVFLNLLGRL